MVQVRVMPEARRRRILPVLRARMGDQHVGNTGGTPVPPPTGPPLRWTQRRGTGVPPVFRACRFIQRTKEERQNHARGRALRAPPRAEGVQTVHLFVFPLNLSP